MNVKLLLGVIAAMALAACGDDGKQGVTNAARELKDPRTVPTATVPATIPTAIPALDVAQAARRPSQTPDVYVVKAGDTPAGIAAELGVELAELLKANNIEDPRALKVGQQLKVPRPAQASATPARSGATPGRTGTTVTGRATASPSAAAATRTVTPTPGTPGSYTVKSGDTACEIAKELGVPLTALAEANGTNPAGLASLRIGQELKVPSTRGPAGC